MKSFKVEKFNKAYSLKKAVMWTVIAYVVAFLLGGDNSALGTLVRGLAGFGLLIVTILLIQKVWRSFVKKDENNKGEVSNSTHD